MENLDNKTIIGGALGILGGIAGTLIAQYAFKKRKESIDRQQKQSKPYYNKKQKQNTAQAQNACRYGRCLSDLSGKRIR